MHAARLPALMLLLGLLTGCPATNQIINNAPAAETPSGANVLAVLQRGGAFVNVGRNGNGDFEVLPGGLPSGGFQLHFIAPYPSNLRIAINGQDLPRFEAVPAGTDPATTGFYRINDIRINQGPARWTVSVRPPNSLLGTLVYGVQVFNVSANPNYAVGTPQHESAPLAVRLVAQRVFGLTVTRGGTGAGRISSNPAGINCGIDCSFDFGQTRTVTLIPHPAPGARFTGWKSDCTPPSVCNCSGPTTNCTITLNGTAATATAEFASPTITTPPAQNCPGPRSIAGFDYVGPPACASGIIDQHPGASLACDSQGYFCCEPANGASEPRCGGPDKRQFAADCRSYGNPNVGPPAGTFDGCYARTGP
jgi:hypothetical protein